MGRDFYFALNRQNRDISLKNRFFESIGPLLPQGTLIHEWFVRFRVLWILQFIHRGPEDRLVI